ncbi:ATP-dependent DNA ligase [Rhodococcus pyridinivorans]|uniref:ATP-dependent DNA ligase n=1 Tax=Rhodococcus TaxID=1827 RepID=UPI00090367B7|nr:MULTISPECIES: ATP-dependent DNA ligase [Rhodococcus]APE07992.1 ATP-dependent DNA ligase [Rhodococcus sp. 2G]UVT26714.1 ATP-dependent DNA ligase [Rhodococcus pyridinivorans]
MPTRTIDGHRITLTNLDKVLYPSTGTMKGEVVEYYEAVAEAMLPHIVGRAATRNRWPNGVGEQSFFEKNLPDHAPAWIDRRTLHHKDRRVIYPLFDSAAGLVWLGQQAALELHVHQWRFDGEKAGPATRIVFDLDPGPGVGLAECAEVARHVRDTVAELGWSAYPVTSGSKGIHLYVPLDRRLSSSGASKVAKQVAHNLETTLPDLVTATMAKSAREGKVFVDWSQNNSSKTTVAPYSLRGRDEPWVAAPRSWDELDDPDLAQLQFREVLARIGEFGDLLAGLDPPLGKAVSGDKAVSGGKTGSGGKTVSGGDALDTYRGKRDASRTPEPVPDRVPDDGPGNRFVIQEHHARRLHYDLRLERDGVLASWAVPKNLPDTSGRNNLAVRTEDHPIEYLTFHGTIPKGEYGAGSMTVWDTGTYETEKWRDDEVIVRFHGDRIEGRYALIRTEKNQWLAHRMKDQSSPSTESSDADPPSLVGSSGSKAFPRDLAPMLASPGDVSGLDAEDWAFEGKWDGYRAIAEIEDGTVRLRSRSGRDVTGDYRKLVELATILDGHRAVLDGEIVAVDRSGVTSFSMLQRGVNYEYRVFDVLYLDGVSLLRKTYDDRRRVLEALAAATDGLIVPDLLSGDGSKALARSRAKNWEGVVAKRRDSVYLPGKRGAGWIKSKNWLTQTVVLGGYRRGNGNRASTFGSLLLGVYDDDGEFVYVGKVGTGFDDETLLSVAKAVKGRTSRTNPFANEVPAAERRDAVWLRPELVGEVRFGGWTEGDRVRHASWRGLRDDVDASSVVREEETGADC